MTKKSSLFLLHQIFDSLTPSEKKIADYILTNTFETIDMTIEQLSENCKTSVASVSRFTKKIGFENFYHLKLAIAKEFVNPSKSLSLNFNKDTSLKEIYAQVAHTNAAIIEESINNFQEDILQEVVHNIIEADHIYLFSMGASSILAVECWNKLSRLGLKCSFAQDFHSQILQASILGENDLAILFSHSGISKDVLLLSEMIKKTSAKSIGITNYAKTPFQQSVDLCLYFTENYESQELKGFSSRIPQLIIIETLYRALSIQLEERSLDILKNYKEIFKSRSI